MVYKFYITTTGVYIMRYLIATILFIVLVIPCRAQIDSKYISITTTALQSSSTHSDVVLVIQNLMLATTPRSGLFLGTVNVSYPLSVHVTNFDPAVKTWSDSKFNYWSITILLWAGDVSIYTLDIDTNNQSMNVGPITNLLPPKTVSKTP